MQLDACCHVAGAVQHPCMRMAAMHSVVPALALMGHCAAGSMPTAGSFPPQRALYTHSVRAPLPAHHAPFALCCQVLAVCWSAALRPRDLHFEQDRLGTPAATASQVSQAAGAGGGSQEEEVMGVTALQGRRHCCGISDWQDCSFA